MTLTTKQSLYLSLIQQAEQRGVSLRVIAEENNIKPANIYAAAKDLRRKGALEVKASSVSSSDFVRMPVSEQMERIELKTQLANGQMVWLGVPSAQLHCVLKTLSL